ncbi:TIR domain-containing protein [Bifidobacterium aquikefiri]|uniref:TIR domain-containing protein n=1 Tax=Bifidobacterium aquikefiri TaxID=1653207 RepID=UPI0039EC16EB
MTDSSNIFISHRHEDDALVDRLKKMLERDGAEICDSSITRETPNKAKSPDYIKKILADQIRWAGKIVVIISPDTKNHPWVDWEIEYARKFENKRIVGVWAPGTTHDDMPDGVRDYANAVVGWSGQKIIDALNGQDNWTEPDGRQSPIQSIPRERC